MTNTRNFDAFKDYYAMLGILPSAEDVVIKGAYRALAQRYHPDRFEGSREEANTHMAELNEAYRVLSDPALRASYDERRLASGMTLATDANMVFEVEQYRPFAEKLAGWGYDMPSITNALIARGVRPVVAETLAGLLSNKRADLA